MKKKIITLLTSMLSSILVFAQTKPVPPSPNTYSLGKYGDLPINYQNGLPDISIPIMSLTDKDVSVDVSLSYYASGIKVDEMASWVGLGWSLNAGGMITRVLRGRADMPIGNLPDKTSIELYNPSVSNYSSYLSRVYPSVYAAATNQTDNEPDLFIFNFCGHTGKFFFNQNKNVILTDYRDMKIQYIYVPSGGPGANSKFIITSEDGVEYEFSACENTFSPHSPDQNITTAWYLSRIKGPAGGEILFNYQTSGSFRHYVANKTVCVVKKTNGNFTIPNILYEPVYANQISNDIVLQSITSGNGSIIFTRDNNKRTDCDQSSFLYALKEISLRDNGQNIVKRAVLKTGYFEANNAEKIANVNLTHLNYRLRLNSVETYEAGNTMAHPPYKFTYFGDDDPLSNDIYNLPYRLSPKQDHWGYYNYSNNTHIFPGGNQMIEVDKWYDMFYIDQNNHQAVQANISNGANRAVNSEAAKANSLRSIQYPTGGNTRFDMESNTTDSGLCGGLRINKKVSFDSLGDSIFVKYTYSGNTLMYSPEKKYFTAFHIYSQNGNNIPALGEDIFVAFGFPPEDISAGTLVKILAFSQSVLGQVESVAYSTVKEQQVGNGYTSYSYILNYPDLWNNENTLIGDGVFLNNLYHSQYLYYGPAYANPLYSQYASLSSDLFTFPYPGIIDISWGRGQLLTKTVFNENNQPIYREDYTYHRNVLNITDAYKAIGWKSNTEFVFAKYYLVGGWVAPKTKTTARYNSAGSITTQLKEEYEYTSIHHKQITKEKITASDESIHSKLYYYSPDYSQSYGNMATLKTKNILKPIDVRSYVARNNQEKLVEGIQTELNNQGQPIKIYMAEPATGQNDIPINLGNPYTFTPKTILNYYTDFNLQALTPESDMTISYIWSYKGQYPIAKVENATYNQMKTALGYTNDSQIESLAGQVNPNVNNIGTLLRSNLPNAFVTTYTYKPLVGIATMTDPRGVITEYDYDSFGRLKKVTRGNKVLEEYYYNYKN